MHLLSPKQGTAPRVTSPGKADRPSALEVRLEAARPGATSRSRHTATEPRERWQRERGQGRDHGGLRGRRRTGTSQRKDFAVSPRRPWDDRRRVGALRSGTQSTRVAARHRLRQPAPAPRGSTRRERARAPLVGRSRVRMPRGRRAEAVRCGAAARDLRRNREGIRPPAAVTHGLSSAGEAEHRNVHPR